MIFTVCYLKRDNQTLFLFRNKKENDKHHGKYLGVGGKLTLGETIEYCNFREFKEETGLTLLNAKLRGEIRIQTDIIYVYVSDSYEGELIECTEGTLLWVKNKNILSLELYPGDKSFLPDIIYNSNIPYFVLAP